MEEIVTKIPAKGINNMFNLRIHIRYIVRFWFFIFVCTSLTDLQAQDLSETLLAQWKDKQKQSQNEPKIKDQDENKKKQSLVDNIPNPFGLELYIRSAGEMYFFHNIDMGASEPKPEDKVTYDFTGRKYRMVYEFDPVYLVSFNAYLSYKFFSIKGEYKTDRVWKGGGEIEKTNNVVDKLNLDDKYSQILDLGIGLFGLRTSFRSVRFNFGTVGIEDVNTKQIVSEANMRLNITEFDISYDFGYKKKQSQKNSKAVTFYKPFIGYRYIEYEMPRIVYQFTDTNADPGIDNYVYVSETDPQNVKSKLHFVGVGVEDLLHREDRFFKFLYQASFYIGGGRSYFQLPDTDSASYQPIFAIMLTLKPGLSFQISNSWFATSLQIFYEINMIYQTVMTFSENNDSENDLGKMTYNFGSVDIYHNINFAFLFRF